MNRSWESLVRDSFDRVHESMHDLLAGLDSAELTHRPGPEANSAGWIAWHATRVQDDHLAELVGRDQVWADGWHTRLALPYPVQDTGFAHSSAEVAAFTVTGPAPLLGYIDAVHTFTGEVLDALAGTDLDRVVDPRWDPPVTLGVRLVSVVNDVTQHVGQIGYVVGLLPTS